MEPRTINVKVAGNIISELSEKIPTQIVALNELIKNSYDAFATEVKINLDIKKSKLIIIDNGKGMGEEDIENLFHLSNSKKEYGKLVFDPDLKLNRKVQGSKGLGFLSVFKFGSHVKWITAKNGVELTFSADRDDIVKLDDISEYTVLLKSKIVEYSGTRIEIDIDTSSFVIKNLIEYLDEDKNALKIVNSFCDDSFQIELEFGKKRKTRKKEAFLRDVEDSILYHVKYSSDDELLKFFFGEELIKESSFALKGDYCLNVDINIYSFKYKRSNREKISKLFCREKDDNLTPLVYVNNNLFHNYELFDPDVMRSIKTSKVLPQMTGFVNVCSDSKDIDFNSDRTNLVNNELTDVIKKDLRGLNILIQDIGSGLKEEYQTKLDGKERDKKSEGNGKDGYKGDEIKLTPANIVLSGDYFEYPVSSGQIDLYSFIESAKNSRNEKINNNDINIYVNGVLKAHNILESQNEICLLNIEYQYDDELTGKCINSLKIRFYEDKKEISGDIKPMPLIGLPNNAYKIKIQFLPNLIRQLNKLAENKNEYKEVIACSLRSLFELSVYELRVSLTNKHLSLIKDIKNENDLASSVGKVINYVKSNNEFLGKIKDNINIDFNSLKNKLSEGNFVEAVKQSHLGAHKSAKYLTDNDIVDIADKASYFIAITNELIFVL